MEVPWIPLAGAGLAALSPSSHPPTSPVPAQVEPSAVEIGFLGVEARVDGMRCACCAVAVEERLRDVPGLRSGTVVDLKGGRVLLGLAGGDSAEALAAAVRAVADAGFTLRLPAAEPASGEGGQA